MCWEALQPAEPPASPPGYITSVVRSRLGALQPLGQGPTICRRASPLVEAQPTTFGAGTFNLGTASCSGTSGYSVCNTADELDALAGPSTFVLEPAVSIMEAVRSCRSAAVAPTATTSARPATEIRSMPARANRRRWPTPPAAATFSRPLATSSVAAAPVFGFPLRPNTISMATFHSPAARSSTRVSTRSPTMSHWRQQRRLRVPAVGRAWAVNGSGVTLVIVGATTACGVTCGDMAFCVGAGFDSVILTAPHLRELRADLLVIGPTIVGEPQRRSLRSPRAPAIQSSRGVYISQTAPIDMSGSGTL